VGALNLCGRFGALFGVSVCVEDERPFDFDALSIASFSVSSCFTKRFVNQFLKPIGKLYASLNDQPPEYFKKKNCS